MAQLEGEGSRSQGAWEHSLGEPSAESTSGKLEVTQVVYL